MTFVGYSGRSKGQKLVDNAEDAVDQDLNLEAEEKTPSMMQLLNALDMSKLGSSWITSRVYDLNHLKKLVLKENKLKFINTDIQYLTRFVYLH